MPTTDIIFFDYEALQAATELGPVSSAFFADFIGQRQWALLEFDDGEAIAEIALRRAFKNGRVEFLVFDRDHPNGYAQRLDADELAIRIEAS